MTNGGCRCAARELRRWVHYWRDHASDLTGLLEDMRKDRDYFRELAEHPD